MKWVSGISFTFQSGYVIIKSHDVDADVFSAQRQMNQEMEKDLSENPLHFGMQ